jgi:1-acyl-sn-glycerol-3-phosphate acyltransferase
MNASAQAAAHRFAREHPVPGRLYACVRAVASAALCGWFRLSVSGREQVPGEGPAILAPNHKNFLDPFFIGIVTPRPVRYMAKIELFRGVLGWLLLRLGAFPVRRGGADAEAIQTARTILSAGGVVVLFPEGTRIEAPDALGSPHHGAGRLALETGAPVVPVAIVGTSHLWRGALPRAKRVQIAFLRAVTTGDAGEQTPSQALIDERVWPAVREEYGRLRGTPGLVGLGLAALGLGGGLLARRRRERGRPPRLLGTVAPRTSRRRTRAQRLRKRLHP